MIKWLADVKKAFKDLGLGLEALTTVVSLALMIGGAVLIYKGIKHAIDIGKMDGKSFLMTLAGRSFSKCRSRLKI